MTQPHETHELRYSDASSFDYVCKKCGRTDHLGGWGDLLLPCLAQKKEEK